MFRKKKTGVRSQEPGAGNPERGTRSAECVVRSAEPVGRDTEAEILHTRGITTRSFPVRTKTVNKDARTVDAVIATEEAVMVFDWKEYRTVYEILLMDGCVIPKSRQVPLLDTHSRWTVEDQVGSARNIRAEGNQLVSTNHFASDERSVRTFNKIADGHVTDNSVGYSVLNSAMIEAGKTLDVNGQTFTAPADRPLRVTTEWELRENSVCSIGADAMAQNRSELHDKNNPNGQGTAITQKEQKRKESTMNFTTWLLERGLKEEDLTPDQLTAMRRDFDADVERKAADEAEKEAKRTLAVPPAPATDESPAPKRSDDPDEAIRMANQVELDRKVGIRKYAHDAVTRAAKDAGVEESVFNIVRGEAIEHCIGGTMVLGQAEAEIEKRISAAALEAVRNFHTPIGNFNINSGRQASVQTLEAGLVIGMRSGGGMSDDDIVRDYGEQAANDGDKFRSMSMYDVACEVLRMEGSLVSRYDQENVIRAVYTSNNLQTVFSNVAHKFIMVGWDSAPETWREVMQVVSASDFKVHTGVRIGSDGRLQLVSGVSGEVKHGKVLEESETYSVGTYAQQIAIGRTHFINDDKGVLSTVPMLYGEEAKETVSDVAYTALLANGTMDDGHALFKTTGHVNLKTSNALASAALTAAKLQFRQLRAPNGRRMGRSAASILVPDELQGTVEELINSTELIAAGGGTNTKYPKKNIHYKTVKPVVETRLSDATFHANASATSWYLSGPPNRGAIAVGFLNGKQAPTISRFLPTADYVKGGMILQVFIDVGAGPMEYRNMQMNTA